MAEEIYNVVFVGADRGKYRGPEFGGIAAANRFTIFGFDEFETNGLYVGAEIKSLHIERKRREIGYGAGGFVVFSVVVHDSCGSGSSAEAAAGNFARKSGACFRISSQSKKASGFSSQMRNQLAISSFSARFCASTLWLR